MLRFGVHYNYMFCVSDVTWRVWRDVKYNFLLQSLSGGRRWPFTIIVWRFTRMFVYKFTCSKSLKQLCCPWRVWRVLRDVSHCTYIFRAFSYRGGLPSSVSAAIAMCRFFSFMRLFFWCLWFWDFKFSCCYSPVIPTLFDINLFHDFTLMSSDVKSLTFRDMTSLTCLTWRDLRRNLAFLHWRVLHVFYGIRCYRW